MQEALKKVTNDAAELIEKSVTLCLRSHEIHLSGAWTWDMQSPAVYCSDVMSFPEEFIGTKGIVYPDDLSNLKAALSLLQEKDLPRLEFRLITTYGQVKTISGQRVSIDDRKKRVAEPVPGKEPWEEFLRQLAAQRENDFLEVRKDLAEYTERLHGIGSWLINKQTGQAWYSDNVFRIYGLAPQSLNAHTNTFSRFIHKDDRITVLDAFEKAYQEQAPLHIEYRIVGADGEVRYIQQVTRWFYAVNGQEMFSGIVRDVTNERAIADELMTDQTQVSIHRQVLKISEQQTATGYWLTDLTTRKTSYSENYYRIYGFKQPSLPSYNSFINLVHADDRARVREHIEKMYNEHALPEIEFRIIRPDGKQRYIKQSGKLFISPNKELIMIGLVQDVSVQKGLEKKILELNEDISLNKAVAEVAETALETSSFIWMPDGYMQWSDGFYRMLGYKPGGIEPLPRFLYKNIYPADLKIFKDAEALLLNHQSHDDIIIRLVSKGALRKVKMSFRQVNYGKEATIALVHDISKQSELSEQFTNNKRFVELLKDSVNDLVIFTNIDNTILHWNNVAEEKISIKKEDALYQNLFDVLPQLKEENFLGQIHFAIKGNEAHSARVTGVYLKRPHDYWLWPLRNEAGEVTGVLHVVHDISKQLELQQQLNERLNFIESLVEASIDRIVVLDRFMNYLYWNKKAEEYYAINKERVLGRNILEIFPTFRNDPNFHQFRMVLRGETVYLPPVANEETNEYFETYLVPIKGEAGEDVSAVLWIVHDLSREYQLTKERTQTANLLHATMDASQDMIQVFKAVRNEEGEIIDFKWILTNHEGEKWMPDVIGKSLLETQPGVVEEGIFDTFKKVVETGIPDQSERHYVHEQFNGWFYQSTVKLNDGIATTTRDITARKKAEQEVLLLKDKIAQKATDKYYTIFNSIDKGLVIQELIYDESGKPVDVRLEEANPAHEKLKGLKNMVGKTSSELGMSTERYWFEKYDYVVKTGESFRFENFHGPTQRWYDISLSRVGEAGSTKVAVVFSDITERKNREQQLAKDLADAQQLQQVSNALIEAENTDLLYEKILDAAKAIMQSDMASIQMFVPEKNALKLIAHKNLHPQSAKLWEWVEAGEGSVCGIALAENKRIIVPDVEAEFSNDTQTLEPFRLSGIRSVQSTPLISRSGKIVGMLSLHWSDIHQSSEHEFRLFDVIARQASDLMERKQVEDALRKNEDKLKQWNGSLEQEVEARTKELQKQLTLLRYTEALAQSGTWEYEIATGEFHWSEGMYKMFGLPLQMKVQPEIYLQSAIEDDRSVAKKIVNHFKKKPAAFEEIMSIKRNNETRTLKIKGSVMHDEEGKAQKVIGVDVDVTDVVKAEEKLKESRHWLEQTTKASPDSITVYDIQKKQPVYLNDCLAEWTGVSNEELIEMGVDGRLKLIHPDDRLNLLHHYEMAATANDSEVITIEYRITTNDDKIIWLRNRSKPFLRDASGKVTHILSVVQNATEEVQLHQQLRERTQFAEAILNASVDRITVFDQDYKFVGWNKRCEQIHRKTKEEVIGKTIFEMFPGIENYPEFMNAQEQSLKGEFIHVPMVRDGYTGDYLELFYIPLKNANGETYAVVNIMHDVSDYVVSTEQLNALNKKLESKNIELEQKNEEITSFAFVASHDMKEPLRKIHTFSDWLMEQEINQLSTKGKSLVEKIAVSVHRMEILIDDILVLTKIHSDTHREENVDLNTILRQVMDEMAEPISETATLIDKDELPAIKANSNQVFYLFKNLISNAIKFQKPGNVPHVTVTSDIVKGCDVKVNEPKEEYLKLSFADNGFGFDQRYAKKIFRVFQRLHGKHEFEGTGIGLAICKKIMENHNGTITVQSEQGKGSVFCCYFPLH